MITLKGPIRIGGKNPNIIEKLKEQNIDVFGKKMKKKMEIKNRVFKKEKK